VKLRAENLGLSTPTLSARFVDRQLAIMKDLELLEDAQQPGQRLEDGQVHHPHPGSTLGASGASSSSQSGISQDGRVDGSVGQALASSEALKLLRAALMREQRVQRLAAEAFARVEAEMKEELVAARQVEG